MSSYHTEQKRLLTEFLDRHPDEALTVDSLYEGLYAEAEGRTVPAKSTLYRLLNRLYEEGEVKRFVPDGQKCYVYERIASPLCHSHLHLRCTDCGRLFHMPHEESDELLLRIRKDCHFAVSEADTVLLGTCLGCTNKKKEATP